MLKVIMVLFGLLWVVFLFFGSEGDCSGERGGALGWGGGPDGGGGGEVEEDVVRGFGAIGLERGWVAGVEAPGLADATGEGGVVGDEVQVAGEGEIGLMLAEAFGEVGGPNRPCVIAGEWARGFVVQDEPGSGVFAAELVAFAPQGFDRAGVGGFAFVIGQGGDDDRAGGCFHQAAAAVADDLRAFEGVHPILGGEEGEGLVAGGVIQIRDGIRFEGAVGCVRIVVAAAEGQRFGKPPGPACEGDGLGKEAFVAEAVEKVAGNRCEVAGKSFREVEPIAAAVEIGEEKDFHGR